MSLFAGIKNAVSRLVGQTPAPKSEYDNQGYAKKEYYSAPSQSTTKTFDTMWSSLPKLNPRVMVPGNGMSYNIDNEIMTGTNASWDPRGEHESVKRLQMVRVPGQLVNDRALSAAVQRSENRDFQGMKPNQV